MGENPPKLIRVEEEYFEIDLLKTSQFKGKLLINLIKI